MFPAGALCYFFLKLLPYSKCPLLKRACWIHQISCILLFWSCVCVLRPWESPEMAVTTGPQIPRPGGLESSCPAALFSSNRIFWDATPRPVTVHLWWVSWNRIHCWKVSEPARAKPRPGWSGGRGSNLEQKRDGEKESPGRRGGVLCPCSGSQSWAQAAVGLKKDGFWHFQLASLSSLATRTLTLLQAVAPKENMELLSSCSVMSDSLADPTGL